MAPPVHLQQVYLPEPQQASLRSCCGGLRSSGFFAGFFDRLAGTDACQLFVQGIDARQQRVPLAGLGLQLLLQAGLRRRSAVGIGLHDHELVLGLGQLGVPRCNLGIQVGLGSI